jgi:hypothetical protein
VKRAEAELKSGKVRLEESAVAATKVECHQHIAVERDVEVTGDAADS